MSSNDYLEGVRLANRDLFKAERINITVVSLEAQIKAAFEAGVMEGLKKEQSNRSLWEKLMGRSNSNL